MTRLQSLMKDLEKANGRLKEACHLQPTEINKDATIQRFEFTFELTWKTLQEYVREQGFDCKSPKSCFREGGRLEIVKNPETLFEFLESRNLISHVYNEKLADRVYQKALHFPQEVDDILKALSLNL